MIINEASVNGEMHVVGQEVTSSSLTNVGKI